jgi:hypothetical protein
VGLDFWKDMATLMRASSSTILEDRMSGISGPVWINGWTGQMVRRLDFTTSKATVNIGNVLSSSVTSTVCMGFCVTQRTLILGSNYVRYASTPLRKSMNPIGPNSSEPTNGVSI